MQTKNRNEFVDMMRGIAMLLVVLGHTMTGCTTGSENSFLFNVVWSLQMPLFVLISGYVTKYGRKISDTAVLWTFIKRRTHAYMLPWAVWSFLIRGVIFGQEKFLNSKTLLWNMDNGYWFLATIWIISLIFGVASFLAERVGKSNSTRRQTALLAIYLVAMAVLFGLGVACGLSFFAMKLTLYYMPFYYAGYLFGQYDEQISDNRKARKIVDYLTVICFIIWLFVILRYSLYHMSDSGIEMLLRAGTSLSGCIAVCGLSKGIFSNKYLGEGYLYRSENTLWKHTSYILCCYV